MSGHRSRAYSPPRNPRASTGQVFVTSFDTSTSTQPGRNSTNNVPGRQNIIYEAQPIRKSHDGKTSKTEYAVRPRQDSVTGTENKRPLTVSTKAGSPSRRGSVVVASPRDTSSPGVVRDESNRFLQPASSLAPRQAQHNQRHNSTVTADLNGYGSGSRDRRDRVYHPPTRSGQPSQKQYYSSRPQPLRYQDEEGWSYTGPREQFDRDFPQRSEPKREGQGRNERPTNVYERERIPAKREAAAPPPPSTSRQLARIEKDDTARHSSRSGFESEPDRYTEAPRRRQSLKTPVLHQQYQQQDDAYSSAREENEPRGHRAREDRYDDEPRRRERHRDSNRDPDRDRDHRRDYDRPPERDRPREYDRSERALDSRRKPRSRDPSPERSNFKTIAAGALGSLATAGTLGVLRKDTKEKEAVPEIDDNKEHRHRRRRRHRKSEDVSEDSDGPEPRRAEGQSRSRQQDESSSETPEDQTSRRERPRRRHRDEEIDQEQREDVDRERDRPRRRHRDEDPDLGQRQDTDRDQQPRSSSRARFREISSMDPGSQTQELVPANRPEYQPQDLETRTMSPGENEDDRPRRVQLVEPVKDNQEIKPRGILKPARQIPFPEDPNPIREGVAPLKDATKDGVPINARWTKINRVLVNPEALEKYNERYEEREDYVIVLRVLSREEIQKLAEKTKEIRETREHEWKRKLEDRQRRKSESGNDNDTEHTSYDDQQEDRPQLAIEAGPPAPPMDLRNLQQQYLSQDSVQPIPLRNMPGSMPVADDDFDRNYSQNV